MDNISHDITSEEVISLSPQEGVIGRLTKFGDALSLRAFVLKMGYCIVDLVFEIMFMVQLAEDGRRGWSYAQFTIAISSPFTMYLI